MQAGGCECWADDSCDQDNLIPDGCNSCGEQAAVSCGITEDDDDDPCSEDVAYVHAAESARTYNDQYVAASELSLGDGAPSVVSLVDRATGEVSQLTNLNVLVLLSPL